MEATVVSAALGAGGILLRKLGKLATDKYTSLGGVRYEMQELKDELESLTACLRDLDSGDDDDNRNQLTRAWMNQVREVGYDADDCIDTFCHHLMIETSYDPGDSKFGGQLAKHIHKIANLMRTLGARSKLATNIKSLKSRGQKASERRLRYKPDAAEAKCPCGRAYEPDSLADASTQNGRASSSNNTPDVSTQNGSSDASTQNDKPSSSDSTPGPQPADDGSGVYGIEAGTDKINRWLLDSSNDEAKDLRVISIVGSAGVGKTTLARTVYTSLDLHGFQHHAFVAVSRNYEPLPLMKSILRNLFPIPIKDGQKGEDPLQGFESWRTKSKVIEKYKEHLANKRYLIILDDVWSPGPWEYLKEAFTNADKTGGRIVVTTRDKKVAKNFGTSEDHIFQMSRLSEDDSKKLLYKTVFVKEKCPPDYEHLKGVCEAILNKCKGLPLATVSIGGMLAQRLNEPLSTLQKVIIKRLPSELQTDGHLHGMRKIVSLSYNELPYHMKACFLYLTVFPEDHEIRRGPLVRRWIAEGFVNAAHGLSTEEIAHRFVDEFVSRNVVTCGQLTSSGDARSFVVHDIMLDIIISKAIQENFVSFLGNPQQSTAAHDNIRRLSIQRGQKEKCFFTTSLPHVRSLTILGSTEKPVEKKIAFAKLTLLRVLDLEGCHWLNNQDLKGICKLSLLRYLSLRRTSISELPSMLGRLKRLETLDVRQTKVRKLPKSVKQLQCLQHLIAGAYVHFTSTHSVKHFAYKEAVKMPRGLSKMKSLRRISFIDVERSGLKALQEVAKLSKLTRLCAMQQNPDGKWGNFSQSMSKLSTSLRYLSIMHHEGTCKNLRQLDFLEHIESPPVKLESLHLVGGLGWLPSWFKDLDNLTSLSLRHNYLGDMVRVLGKLPSLVSLKLYSGAYTGSELCFESDQVPVLKQLVVDNLSNLDKLSFESGAPKNLEMLTLFLPRGSAGSVLGIEKLEKLSTRYGKQ